MSEGERCWWIGVPAYKEGAPLRAGTLTAKLESFQGCKKQTTTNTTIIITTTKQTKK